MKKRTAKEIEIIKSQEETEDRLEKEYHERRKKQKDKGIREITQNENPSI